jgi:hypothetical protein
LNISFWLYFASDLFSFFQKPGTKVEKETPGEIARKEVLNNGELQSNINLIYFYSETPHN